MEFRAPNKLPKHMKRVWMGGYKRGIEDAREQIHIHLAERMNSLTELQGIGKKRQKEIMKHILS